MAYSHKDTVLLSEAYTLQLLKESIPAMSLKQVNANVDLMTESEAQYICDISEKILNEFWGGVKNLLGAGANAAKQVGNAAVQGGKAVGQAVGNAAVRGGQAVGDAASGAVNAAKQMGSNVKDIYNTGVVDQQSQKSVEKARQLTQQLMDLVVNAQKQGLIKAQESVSDMSLADLVDLLDTAKQSAGTFKQSAQDKGFTGGVGTAFQQGRQRSAQGRQRSAQGAPQMA